MMDNKIFIARLKKEYHFAEVGKFYCVKVRRGLSPQGVDCWVVDLVDEHTLSAYVCDLDWVRYYFDFEFMEDYIIEMARNDWSNF